MDALTITFVTASTALTSAVFGPFVSYVIARRQIRASVISNNRERWNEALLDSLAEYIGLLLSAAMIKQSMGQDPLKAVSEDRALLQIVERGVLVKSKVMLMTNPKDSLHIKLCEVLDATYQALVSNDPQTLAKIRSGSEAITQAGRDVLKAEWARVKRGD
jgi:hypothetical protein